MSAKELYPSDELVKIIMKEGKTLENITVLYGFIAEGQNEDTITFFTDIILQNSLEVKIEDILHSVKVSKTHSPFGGTYIWLQKASEYLNGVPFKSAADAQKDINSYFQGPINDQYAQQSHTCCGNCKEQQPVNFTQNCQPTVPPICIPNNRNF